MRFREQVVTTADADAAFSFLVDFGNLRTWDPSVRRVRRLTRGAVGLDTRFRVDMSFLGLPSSLDYRVEEFEPPRRAVLVGTTLVCTATDTIVVEPLAEGCKVTWQADIHFAGPIALLDPLFAWLFSSSVKAAVQEMRYCLDRLEGNRPVKKASARKPARRK